MDLADCYQLLGLSTSATITEVKASYRELVRQYHPDINPGDQRAKDKFIALTEAYKLLMSIVQPDDKEESVKTEPVGHQEINATPQQPLATKITRKEKPNQNIPPLSETEKQMKWRSCQQLEQFLKYQRFPKAIILAENLAQRLPHDPEVRSWQAIAYQRWGSQLVNEKKLDKARIYLKKALKTDPHNRALWFEIERDFRRIEQIY